MLSDYIEQFCEEKGLFRFEGDSGLHNFETLLKGIGYVVWIRYCFRT